MKQHISSALKPVKKQTALTHCRVATMGTTIIGKGMVRKITQGRAWVVVEVHIGVAEVQEMEGK